MRRGALKTFLVFEAALFALAGALVAIAETYHL
jgi:hypothetical protein